MPAPWIKRRRRQAAAEAAVAEVKVAPVVTKPKPKTKIAEPVKVVKKVIEEAPVAPKRRVRKTTAQTEE